MTEHDFREPIDIEGKKVRAFDIEPLDVQKRLRVLGGWLVEAVFDGMNMYNHTTRMNAWLHQAHTMQNKYPLHAKTIDDIIISVWARYQYVWKTEIKPSIDEYKAGQKARRRNTIRIDLDQLGF